MFKEHPIPGTSYPIPERRTMQLLRCDRLHNIMKKLITSDATKTYDNHFLAEEAVVEAASPYLS
jgi:hypothetical protein